MSTSIYSLGITGGFLAAFNDRGQLSTMAKQAQEAQAYAI
jgi:hypothetical protein